MAFEVKAGAFMSPVSYRYLTVIFLLALLVVAVVRFDAESLVREQLAKVAVRTDTQLDFDQMSISGFGAGFSHLSVNSPRLPEALIFEKVRVSPLWRSVIAGEGAADVSLNWQGNSLAVTVIEEGALLRLKQLQLQGEMSKLLRLVIPYIELPFSVSASGTVDMDGESLLDKISGRPHSGELHATWCGVKAGAMGAEFALGDLVMALQGESGQWQWQLNDAEAGMVDASGMLKQLSAPASMWPIDGMVVIDVTKIRDPYLVAWLPDMGDEKIVRLKISGTLSRPKLDRIK